MERTVVKDVANVGLISIANDVVAVIAAIAALKIKGVASMSGGLAEDLARRVSGRNSSKGVMVIVEDEAMIDLRIFVEYGHEINDVCRQVQIAVKESIESMTDIIVSTVNVKVDGVDMLAN